MLLSITGKYLLCSIMWNLPKMRFFCAAKKEDGEKMVQCPFSITNSRQNFELEFSDGKFLEAGDYVVWVENKDGVKTMTKPGFLYPHRFSGQDEIRAYPNCVKGYDRDNKVPHIYAEVAFQKYEAKKEEDGNYLISYPSQSVGTAVKVYFEDEYGCSTVVNLEVRDRNVSVPKLRVWREGVGFIRDQLKSDERLCVDVNGTVYYSDYGAGNQLEDLSQALTFPALPNEIKELTIWVESTMGSSSEKQSYAVEGCNFNECLINYNAYLRRAIGTVNANKLGQGPTTVSVILDGQEYSTEISQDGSFSLEYPQREKGEKIHVIFRDAHGCSKEVSAEVHNTLAHKMLEGDPLLDRYQESDVPEGAKVYVSVGGNEYASEVSTRQNGGRVMVMYPRQEPGTKITAWLQNDTTTEISQKTY